jgi:hypothetical protein
MPLDKETEIINRYLNYPSQEQYKESDLQLIIYGDVNYTRKYL